MKRRLLLLLIAVPCAADLSTVALAKADTSPRRGFPDPSGFVEVLKLEGHTSQVWGVAFHPSGKIVVSGGYDKTIRIWDVRKGEEIRNIQTHASQIYSVDVSPDRKQIVS